MDSQPRSLRACSRDDPECPAPARIGEARCAPLATDIFYSSQQLEGLPPVGSTRYISPNVGSLAGGRSGGGPNLREPCA
jgi:hypothetical protein